MKVLCVAEKPSISKSISQILSGGQFTTRNTATNYVKNYDFNYPQTNSQFTVTCVAGHLMHHDFAESHRKWHTCDPFALFEAPIVDDVASDKKSIARNLSAEAKKVQQLMIWTDCDREGENIGAEIAKICRQANRNITVKRARFSAIIAQQIHHAAQHPVELDMAQAAAVDARIILDLRIGAAFTRMQTKSLQQTFPQISEVVSYGPCQYPTLGFVVSRYKQVKLFVPEKFWFIYLAITRDAEDDSEEVPFTWKHGHVYEEIICQIRLEDALLNETARVTRVTKKDTKKWKPLPLTTVELQKAGSRILKLAPKKILDIAEKLYQNGFLSYPRTETDQFDPQFDFMSLIGKQTVDPAWGQYATGLQNGGFANPRRGKNNDQAHPPIHPTAHAGNIAGDDKRVYEFITRRFLACCSKDALGFQTTVDIVYGREEFSATGLIVLERNYLDVYPYDKWSTKELPDFQEGEEFVPSICELREGQTSKPSLLTEADLVGLMDKNGIGTDATIAQHIETIIDREYVIARMEGATKYLVPSSLGMGLIEGYNAIGFDRSLSKPQLRRMTERAMVEICQGTKEKIDMLEENIEQYKDMFIKARAEFPKVTAVCRHPSLATFSSDTNVLDRASEDTWNDKAKLQTMLMDEGEAVALPGGVVGVVEGEVAVEVVVLAEETMTTMTVAMAEMAEEVQVQAVGQGAAVGAQRAPPQSLLLQDLDGRTPPLLLHLLRHLRRRRYLQQAKVILKQTTMTCGMPSTLYQQHHHHLIHLLLLLLHHDQLHVRHQPQSLRPPLPRDRLLLAKQIPNLPQDPFPHLLPGQVPAVYPLLLSRNNRKYSAGVLHQPPS
ncbi:DNA topoisomerase [Amylostereum chailletii]|nr:DNA topoisomerase [Amylostereum chailletii]